ncbi:DUF3693 domain-containing protein [Stenotrophomonas sp. EMP41]|uniref:DUF3693 domain-containing protein n=1 Tax=Stenotrophomonas sp. EMP41 TaxID=3396625 RepID=UPI0039C0BDE2
MSATSDLLDRVRDAANIPSDNVLSQRLGITRAVISGWRNGNYPVPDERIAQLCDMAKLDGPLWMALIHAERATSAVERKIWRLMLDRISAAAAVVALVALSMPGLANAKTAQIQAVSGADNGGMYIMFQASPGTLAYRSPQSPALLCQAKKPASQPAPRGLAATASSFVRSGSAATCSN